ncbi:MAG: NUDIX hydrolase [candidate division KSB1 bacterium]|nr:NUDIX hydrolase [candidate division KSB1 bacterium]
MSPAGCGQKPAGPMAEPEILYCPKCGASMVHEMREGRRRPVCSRCGYVHYWNPAPAVAVVILQNGQVLLVRRKYEPRQGLWSLPAGFVEWDEDIREAAVRETKEETGCDVAVRELLGVYSAFDDERTHVVLIVFRGELLGGRLQAGDDASEVRFFPLASLPDDFAFRVHRQVLEEIRHRSEM